MGGGKGGSITGPGGREIAGGKSGNVVIGPNGNIHASGTKGAAVKGPGGAAIAGRHAGATVGPEGAAAHVSRGGIATGPGGTIAGGSRAGIATGPGGTIAGGIRAGIATGANGTIAGGSRAGIATGLGGTIAGGSRGDVAVGPYGAAAAGGRFVAGSGAYGAGFAGTRFVAASDLHTQGTYIRNNFSYYNAFTPNWYARYPGAWYAAGWATGSAWAPAPWATCSAYCGYPADTTAIYYNYGYNVTYQGGSVYYDGQEVATEGDYAEQAAQIATGGQTATPADDDQWQALGVFAMAKSDETTSNNIFQLALNKDGVVRGNYYNAVADSTVPVSGALDKKSQRVAWSIQGNQDTVYETGLYNLTQDDTTMLVHHGKDHTEQYQLIRVPQQDDQGSAAQPN
jgi:hypothetical protein